MNADAAAPPRALIVVAAVLALALAVTVAIIGLTSGGETPPAAAPPLPLPAVDAPDAGSSECAKLVAKLPDAVQSAGEQLERRKLAEPAPEAAAAWGESKPVVLRCGVPKPAELTSTSKLLQTDGVRWLPVAGTGSTTYYAVDRAVYVALTVPDGSGTGVVQDISKAVRSALQEQRPRP